LVVPWIEALQGLTWKQSLSSLSEKTKVEILLVKLQAEHASVALAKLSLKFFFNTGSKTWLLWQDTRISLTRDSSFFENNIPFYSHASLQPLRGSSYALH
jgi:hypothetical protein